MVASIDHGPLSPSALVTRTIASTRATPMSGLAGGILAFGELHGAVVSRAMRHPGRAPPADGSLDEWADEISRPSAQRADGCRASGTAGTTTTCAPNACSRLAARLDPTARHEAAVRALAARVARHSGRPRPGEHRRSAGRGADRAAARPRVRRLPVRDRAELRPGRALRGGAGPRATDADDRSDRGPVRRRRRSRDSSAGGGLNEGPADLALSAMPSSSGSVSTNPGCAGRCSASCRREIGSEEFMAGITIFEPGESSSYHVQRSPRRSTSCSRAPGCSSRRGRRRSSRPATRCGCPRAFTTSTGTPARPAQASLGVHAAGATPPDLNASTARAEYR